MSLRIAIIGSGIGGLTAAILTARDGHRPTLFERFGKVLPLGSGLVIQPVGMAVLDHIGAGDEARLLSSPITRMIGDEARSHARALDVRYPRGAPGRAFHRASLFHLLWQGANAAGVPVVTSAEVTHAPLDGAGRRIRLNDGRDFGPFDLVIDASGARSALSPLRARPLGYGAVWASVPWPKAATLPQDQLRQRYLAAHQMAGAMPIGRLPDDPAPMAAVFWSVAADRLAAWRATPLSEWKAGAMTLWPELEPFLVGLTQHAHLTEAVYTHGTLRRPFDHALVHIGDAAHRASPQLGQGANMALLDAFALSLALRQPLDDALPDYAAMRRWHVRSYQMLSAMLTPMYQSDSRWLPVLRDRFLAPVSRLPGVSHLLTRLVAGYLTPPVAGHSAALRQPVSLRDQTRKAGSRV
ncbi:FAD-dependent oxidoreductase [Paracoccus sp. (in: a-proteobacteria)]|uniref:FAD-dependent oxidoreductase n=1 Tax=Paracoccus sp. TaxID=267 RepID=UPI003A84C04B